MIDKKIGEKHIYFELSIGNSGNSVDGHNVPSYADENSDTDDTLGTETIIFTTL